MSRIGENKTQLQNILFWQVTKCLFYLKKKDLHSGFSFENIFHPNNKLCLISFDGNKGKLQNKVQKLFEINNFKTKTQIQDD